MDVLKFLWDISNALGFINSIRNRFFGSPNVAFDKLVVVLEEIKKIYLVIDTSLTEYLSLDFSQTSLQDEKKTLIRIEGGELLVRVQEARPHCSKISRIYDNYLKTWFAQILNSDEQAYMQHLFTYLADSDGDIVFNLEKIASWVTKEASFTLSLVDAGQLEEANARINSNRRDILNLRLAISRSVATLFELEAQLVSTQVAGLTLDK